MSIEKSTHQRILALDIGTRKTGLAFFDPRTQCTVPVPTLSHSSVEECVQAVCSVIRDRDAEFLVIGMPYLPDGSEGQQARHTREVVRNLQKHSALPLEWWDERYTSWKEHVGDSHAAAACTILSCWLEQQTQ